MYYFINETFFTICWERFSINCKFIRIPYNNFTYNSESFGGINLELKQQVEKSNEIESNLEKLNKMSEEITFSIEEQNIGLQETVKATEHINQISSKVKDISIKIEKDFESFKTN